MESESSSHKWRSSVEVLDEGYEEGIDGGVAEGAPVGAGEAAKDVCDCAPVLPEGYAEAEEVPEEAEALVPPPLEEGVSEEVPERLSALPDVVAGVVEALDDTPALLAGDFDEDGSDLVVPELLGPALDEAVEDFTTELLEDDGEAGGVDELGAALELFGTVVDEVTADDGAWAAAGVLETLGVGSLELPRTGFAFTPCGTFAGLEL